MAATAEPAELPAAKKPRRPRRRKTLDDAAFGSLTPWTNPAAVYSYAVGLVGMTPVLGLVLGPVAVLLGVAGWVRLRQRPEVKGLNFLRAGMLLGTLDFAFNAAGLACIAKGLGWI